MKGQEVLILGTRMLTAAGIAGAAIDARRLMAHAIGVAPDRLMLALHDPISPEQVARFRRFIDQRALHQPVAQITGERLFWGRVFHVTSDTLDPRPETEILIEAALAEPFTRVLDLGTGTGCILLTLLAERPEASGLGVDLSPAALAVARTNADQLNLGARAAFGVSDWFAQVDGMFDLIVSNPPYIRADEMANLSPDVRDWEPHMALTPGGDGLGPYRIIAAQAMAHLCDGGRLVVEIGPTQGAAVTALLRDAGFAEIAVRHDLDGRDRTVIGRKPKA